MGEHNDAQSDECLGYVGPENYGLPPFKPEPSEPEPELTESELTALFSSAADIFDHLGFETGGEVDSGATAEELYQELVGTTAEDWDADPERYRSLARQVRPIAAEHVSKHEH